MLYYFQTTWWPDQLLFSGTWLRTHSSRGLLHDPVPPFLLAHQRPPPSQLVNLPKADPSHSIHGIWKREICWVTTPILDPPSHSAVGVTSLGLWGIHHHHHCFAWSHPYPGGVLSFASRTAQSHTVPPRSKGLMIFHRKTAWGWGAEPGGGRGREVVLYPFWLQLSTSVLYVSYITCHTLFYLKCGLLTYCC